MDDRLEYELVAFDAHGAERPAPGGPTGADLARRLAADPPTDVFVLSHGWMGDVPAAHEQYGRWVAAMAACDADLAAAHARPGGFRPAVIGVHWPSLAWGDENLPAGSFAAGGGAQGAAVPDGATAADPVAELVASTAAALSDDGPDVTAAVRVVVEAALEDAAPVTLPRHVREAYREIDAATGLAASGDGSAPGDDRAPFDAEAAYQACLLEDVVSFGSVSLGGLLAPLRVLTFWQMKRRAQRVGSSGVAALLAAVQSAAPGARVHLMGHSFGCIVVSSALSAGSGTRPPAASLVLAQGAMSLWSFCSSIPSAPDRPGFFHPVVRDGRVAGPVVVTTSVHDRAVGKFYPLGAGARGQLDYGPGELPRFGAIGTFGVRGPGVPVVDGDLLGVDDRYDLRPGVVHDLRADAVICVSAGLMGAHSDIAKPAVAHAVWSAATATQMP